MQNLLRQTIIKISAVCLILIVIESCDKEEITVDECCTNFEPSKNYAGYTYMYDANMYGYPRFSPTDTNEFIYLDLYNEEQGDLYKYNISDSVFQFLTSNIAHTPNWSKKDWIAYNILNKIWIIKSNGDSLQNIYPNNSNYYPTWSPNGTILLFETVYENYSKAYFGDLYENLIDSADLPYINGDWSPDSIKIATPIGGDDEHSISYYNLSDKNFYTIVKVPIVDGDSFFKGMDWMPDSRSIIWATGNGVNITDIETQTTSQILCSCDAIEYIHPSVSYDGTKLLLEKITRSKPSENVIFEDHSIVLMNIDGTDEVTILE